jgi:dynein heavy chain
MRSFKAILTVIMGAIINFALQNEALRPRHWKTLMDVTGKSFQTNSKTFTLESVFGMELHKYAEKIAEITR